MLSFLINRLFVHFVHSSIVLDPVLSLSQHVPGDPVQSRYVVNPMAPVYPLSFELPSRSWCKHLIIQRSNQSQLWGTPPAVGRSLMVILESRPSIRYCGAPELEGGLLLLDPDDCRTGRAGTDISEIRLISTLWWVHWAAIQHCS